MKNHFPFDQHFKNQLEDAESFVPDNMFEKIMAERKQQQGFALFFQNRSLKYGLTACAMLAAAGLLFLKQGQKNVPQPAVSTIVASLPAKKAAPSETIDMPQNIKNESSKTLKLNSLDEKLVTPIQQKLIETRVLKPTLVDIIPNVAPPVSPVLPQKNLETTVLKQTLVDLSQANEMSPNLLSNLPIAQEHSMETEKKLAESPSIAQGNSMETEKKGAEFPITSPITQLPTNKVSGFQVRVNASQVQAFAQKLGPDINCPDFNLRKPIRWYIDIWGSPDYVFRKLYNNQGENTIYANHRDSVEHSWYGFSAGARASLVLESGVAIRAGLNYLQNNEIFDYKKPGQVRTVTITETVKQPNGTTLTTTRMEKQYGTYQLKKYNRYRSIDVPIQLGYEFGRMPWSYSVNGGINFNVTSWRKAQILNPALVPFDASEKDANVFKNNVGASLYASFAAYYDWKDYTQLFVEPYIRHFLSPITTKDYLLEQRYTDVGLKFGVRWRIR
jgi:hypothetical protein